jgi:hypothetical protein
LLLQVITLFPAKSNHYIAVEVVEDDEVFNNKKKKKEEPSFLQNSFKPLEEEKPALPLFGNVGVAIAASPFNYTASPFNLKPVEEKKEEPKKEEPVITLKTSRYLHF